MNTTRNLSIGEHDLIGDIISDSFSDDPVNLWVFSAPKGMKPYFTSAAKKLYLAKGFGHVMEDQSGGSLWLPPNVQDHIPLIESIDIALSMVKHSGFKSIAKGLALDSALAKAKPQQPYYYLFAIGARPNQKGKGIGRKLMEAGLKNADEEKMPAYLESSKELNVSFYKRFGFEVIEKLTPAKNCPPLWLMWRESK